MGPVRFRAMRALASVVAIAALAACSAGSPDTATPTGSSGTEHTNTAPASPERSSHPSPKVRLDVARIHDDIAHLSQDIGPRHATSKTYRKAATWVQNRFEKLGYEVSRMPVDAPAGNTWGVDVRAGNSPNIIADAPGFDATEAHVIIGAHLDTIPVAPGAEDNGSGVAVMLEVARVVAEDGVSVRFIAFGAEEPRGPGDDLHHFGSQTYVHSLNKAQRSAMKAMVALDRVGVAGKNVPICTGGRGTKSVRKELKQAANAIDVPASICADNRTSDHWSFERNGLPSARLGSIPYAGYHSPEDTLDVVSKKQLKRVARIMIEWLDGR